MTVYVDDAFCTDDDWGRWKDGGHLQADTLEELHQFAVTLGLRQTWFQDHRLPERAHYDLTASMRKLAIARGAKTETVMDGTLRRLAIRNARKANA